MCQRIKQAFRDHSSITSINQTYIMFIPMVEQAILIRQFRPISLCNAIYKVNTKIITTQLKYGMAGLFLPTRPALF